jgi:transcriptional regulator with XRE-family HTH domain
MYSIGSRIREARGKAGLNLTELVEKTGISRGSVSKHEHGKAIPRIEALHAYSKALDVTVEWLKHGDGVVPLKPESKSSSESHDIKELFAEKELVNILSKSAKNGVIEFQEAVNRIHQIFIVKANARELGVSL